MLHRFCIVSAGDTLSTQKMSEAVALAAVGGCLPLLVNRCDQRASAAPRHQQASVLSSTPSPALISNPLSSLPLPLLTRRRAFALLSAPADLTNGCCLTMVTSTFAASPLSSASSRPLYN
mmetsp:Transcript_3548/g.7676  ORF Transcript_3548/g.7676 Transcript_3548/m.7676 type:complete len:120 (-) Transcript_3548:767-1126(-)